MDAAALLVFLVLLGAADANAMSFDMPYDGDNDYFYHYGDYNDAVEKGQFFPAQATFHD